MIQINDEWRVRYSDNQLVLEQKRVPKKADSKEAWGTMGYFSSHNEIWPVLLRKMVIAIPGDYDIEGMAFLDRAVESIRADIMGAIGKTVGLSDVRVLNRAMTAAEAQALYDAGPNPREIGIEEGRPEEETT